MVRGSQMTEDERQLDLALADAEAEVRQLKAVLELVAKAIENGESFKYIDEMIYPRVLWALGRAP